MKTSGVHRGPGKDVFINCPFDDDYQPVFRAVVFAIHACGLNPRRALEIDDGAEVRVEKIIRIMRGCPLSVYDISRTALDRSSKLPRFNMPFELGLYLGLARGSGRKRPSLILDTERYRYQQFISDIAGQDIRAHASDPLRAITHIRDWLNTLFPFERLMGDWADALPGALMAAFCTQAGQVGNGGLEQRLEASPQPAPNEVRCGWHRPMNSFVKLSQLLLNGIAVSRKHVAHAPCCTPAIIWPLFNKDWRIITRLASLPCCMKNTFQPQPTPHTP